MVSIRASLDRPYFRFAVIVESITVSVPKRHHTVPLFYLRGFTAPDHADRLWVYEKGNQLIRPGNAKDETVRRHYYTQQTEEQKDVSFETLLNEKYEKPADPVIIKIRDKQVISRDDKKTLAVYIAVLLKRTPAYKNNLQRKFPGFVEELRREEHDELNRLLVDQPSAASDIERIKNIIDTRLDEHRDNISQNDFLQSLYLRLIEFGESPNYVAAMTWQFVTNPGGRGFLTSDNPVHWFKSIGIGTEFSEICFPISTDIALFASWQRDLSDCRYINIPPEFEQQINRRVVLSAERFIYYSKKKDWVRTLVNMRSDKLYSKLVRLSLK